MDRTEEKRSVEIIIRVFFSLCMAGGGIKGGVTYGKTDEFSYNVAENEDTPHDLYATILLCMGRIDSRGVTFG